MQKQDEVLFRMEEREGRGKMLIATQDILPGTVVLKETDPLMVVSADYFRQFESRYGQVAQSIASVYVFRGIMSSEQKEKYLQMFGPTEGVFADMMRKLYQMIGFGLSIKDYERLSEEDQAVAVKVSCIFRLNAFANYAGDSMVYATACRLSHSCAPNCERDFEGTTIIVRAIKPIHAGDDLSVAYHPGRSLETTAERRFKWLQTKDFTCHCPRCDAPGDDTRQFDCFDSKCTGCHFACQPRREDDIGYTGVEYVEPHLLPCTACQRPPPVEYQARMLEQEKHWEAQLGKWEAELPSMLEGSPAKILSRIRELAAMEMPRWHRRTLQHSNLHTALCVKYTYLQHTVPHLCPKAPFHYDLKNALRCLEILEHILPSTDSFVQEELSSATMTCLSMDDFALMKALCQRALRSSMICSGREKRAEKIESRLVYAMQQLQSAGASAAAPVIDSTSCAFCEESPERAAMKRSRCGACKAVMYCSVGCQKAHWKIHKAQCKKV